MRRRPRAWTRWTLLAALAALGVSAPQARAEVGAVPGAAAEAGGAADAALDCPSALRELEALRPLLVMVGEQGAWRLIAREVGPGTDAAAGVLIERERREDGAGNVEVWHNRLGCAGGFLVEHSRRAQPHGDDAVDAALAEAFGAPLATARQERHDPPRPRLPIPASAGQRWRWEGTLTTHLEGDATMTRSAVIEGEVTGAVALETPHGVERCWRVVEALTFEDHGAPVTIHTERWIQTSPYPRVLREVVHLAPLGQDRVLNLERVEHEQP